MPEAYFAASPLKEDSPYHHLFDFQPAPGFAFRADDGPPMSREGLDRLIGYYARMRDQRPAQGGQVDMWAKIVSGHGVLTEPLEARDHARLAAVLQDIGMTPLVQGFATYIQAPQLRRSERGRQWEAMQFVDKLISLGEARQLVPVVNPEQGSWRLKEVDLPRMIAACFTVDGRQIPPPRAGGSFFGAESPLGVYSLKDVKSLYTALRAEEVLARCSSDFGVAEIGGGLGVLAYYSQQLRPRRYRLYDLPTVSVMQGYFLMRSLGEEKVRLWGEGDGDGAQVAPYWLLYESDEATTLFINQDSFPEINLADAQRYMETIVRCRPEYFLSINQEARAPDGVGGRQLVVSDLTEPRGELERLYRGRDWLRKGWVEELYRHRNPRLS